MTVTNLEPQLTDAGDDTPGLNHVFCECDPDRALCGEDLADAPEIEGGDETPDDCLVCFYLNPKPCERCGK